MKKMNNSNLINLYSCLNDYNNVFRDDIGNISKINHFYIVRPISISSESPKKLYKKGLPHRCEQA